MTDDQEHGPGDIGSVPLAKKNEKPPAMNVITEFLERFGYLPPADYADRGVDETVSEGLTRYQESNSLTVSGEFDEPTRSQMAMSRCGLPDVPSGEVAFAVACRWEKAQLTYVLDTGTADTPAQTEWPAVRAAFATWQALGVVEFTEVNLGASPDIFVDWRPADDPDLSMLGTPLAHADFPPGCSVVSSGLPLPIHFDDSEHTWSIGAAAGAFDVETVALHEIGHILGLQHSSTAGAVMQATASPNTTLRNLTQDDIDGFRSLYAKVPRVLGQRRDQASQLVRNAGLVPQFIGIGIGVATQSPVPDKLVRPGSVVTMTMLG